MPVIVMTRLRLRDPALLDEFFTDAVAAIEQAMKSDGNLGADALADAKVPLSNPLPSAPVSSNRWAKRRRNSTSSRPGPSYLRPSLLLRLLALR
jgi:hypothetical protein